MEIVASVVQDYIVLGEAVHVIHITVEPRALIVAQIKRDQLSGLATTSDRYIGLEGLVALQDLLINVIAAKVLNKVRRFLVWSETPQEQHWCVEKTHQLAFKMLEIFHVTENLLNFLF